MTSFLLHILTTLLLSILKIVCLLIAIAYFTLAERKIMAAVQRRVGPNVVGPFGLLQPLADGLKLAGKELAVPAQASSRIFLSVAITVLLFALSGWSAIPFGMFDHSEHMDINTVAKILILTEPQTISFPSRSRSIDESGVLTTPRGGPRTFFDWQVTVEAILNRFFGAVEFVPTGNNVRLYEGIKITGKWAAFLNDRVCVAPVYIPTEEEARALASTDPEVWKRFIAELKPEPTGATARPEIASEEIAHATRMMEAAWPAPEEDEPKA